MRSLTRLWYLSSFQDMAMANDSLIERMSGFNSLQRRRVALARQRMMWVVLEKMQRLGSKNLPDSNN